MWMPINISHNLLGFAGHFTKDDVSISDSEILYYIYRMHEHVMMTSREEPIRQSQLWQLCLITGIHRVWPIVLIFSRHRLLVPSLPGAALIESNCLLGKISRQDLSAINLEEFPTPIYYPHPNFYAKYLILSQRSFHPKSYTGLSSDL